MAATLSESFRKVRASDVHAYGFGETVDFLAAEPTSPDADFDWIVTNPPFRFAEEFARRAIARSRVGSAMLVRTNFIEGAGRYRRLFEKHPPVIVAQFVERVPILRGRVDRAASTATSYCWLVWRKGDGTGTRLIWIPPCRRELERDGDYIEPSAKTDLSGDAQLSSEGSGREREPDGA